MKSITIMDLEGEVRKQTGDKQVCEYIKETEEDNLNEKENKEDHVILNKTRCKASELSSRFQGSHGER